MEIPPEDLLLFVYVLLGVALKWESADIPASYVQRKAELPQLHHMNAEESWEKANRCASSLGLFVG